MDRRLFLTGAAAAVSPLGSMSAVAKDPWPTRPVRVVSPYAPGGGNDISARIFCERFSVRLKEKFLVENKPGAGTRIGNETVARADPDGYTLLYAAGPYATAEALFGKLSYDPRKDLTPIAGGVLAPLFLIVNANAPYKTLAEFIAYGKSKPDGLTFASPGPASTPHLLGELFFRTAGVKGLTVQFRGDAPAYTELLAGRVDATLTVIAPALPHIETGGLRVLGCASPERSAIYDAPTLREQGMTNVTGAGWYGFMAPSATPTEIVKTMQGEIAHALADAATKDKFRAQGLEPFDVVGDRFGAFIENEGRRWGEIIRDAKITAG